MKVSIGQYKNWFGIHQLVGLLEKIEVEEDTRDTIIELLEDTWVEKLLNFIDSKRKRKVKIQIDKYDTWSMDHTLSLIIVPMLKQLRDTTNSYPASLSNDDYSNGFEEWKKILNEMIWVFEEIAADEEPSFITYCDKDHREAKESPFDKGKYFYYEKEKARLYYKRKKEALALFGKYFEDLWD